MQIDTNPRPDHFYMLDEHGEPFAIDDLRVWAKWFQTADRIVARTAIGRHVVSTVFLGIDHGWQSEMPLLYESLVFVRQPPGAEFAFMSDGQYEMRRYATREQALAGHQALVAHLQSGLRTDDW